jgi:hypothetical protein
MAEREAPSLDPHCRWKLDRFRGDVAEEFRRVDRRLLRLEARAIG